MVEREDLEEETMNTYVSQSLVQEHIRESRQQAAAARKVRAARGIKTHARWFGHRTVRGA
jgi:hypothetical protein